jgi:hypothetical protein
LRPHLLLPSFRFLLSLLPLRTATATAVFYYYRWLQPLSITTTLHSCRSRPPPLSTDTAKFLPLFSTATVFYRRRFLPALSTATAKFLPTPLSTDAALCRACYNRHDRRNRNRHDCNRLDRRDRNRYNLYFNHRRNRFNRFSSDNCRS